MAFGERLAAACVVFLFLYYRDQLEGTCARQQDERC